MPGLGKQINSSPAISPWPYSPFKESIQPPPTTAIALTALGCQLGCEGQYEREDCWVGRGDFRARQGFKGKQNEAKQRMNTMSYGDQLNH